MDTRGNSFSNNGNTYGAGESLANGPVPSSPAQAIAGYSDWMPPAVPSYPS